MRTDRDRQQQTIDPTASKFELTPLAGVAVTMTAGVIAARIASGAVAPALAPYLSPGATRLVETILVGLVLLVGVWRLLWLPQTRRRESAATCPLQLVRVGDHRRVAPLSQRTVEAPERGVRHLRLVD